MKKKEFKIHNNKKAPQHADIGAPSRQSPGDRKGSVGGVFSRRSLSGKPGLTSFIASTAVTSSILVSCLLYDTHYRIR